MPQDAYDNLYSLTKHSKAQVLILNPDLEASALADFNSERESYVDCIGRKDISGLTHCCILDPSILTWQITYANWCNGGLTAIEVAECPMNRFNTYFTWVNYMASMQSCINVHGLGSHSLTLEPAVVIMLNCHSVILPSSYYVYIHRSRYNQGCFQSWSEKTLFHWTPVNGKLHKHTKCGQ